MGTMDLSNGPLSGLRVVEMTVMWAGPTCGLLLTYMGAEVIKVESSALADSTRDREGWMWSELNGGRLSAAVNLKRPEGVALLKRLLAQSDVFFYNMRQMALDRLGLDSETLLREVNPRLVIMSMSGSGATGPERDYSGVATTFAAAGGVAHLSGYPGKAPFELIAWPDLEFADWGMVALFAALAERDRTGTGMFIDLAANEALTWYSGETFLELAMTGRVAGRDGTWPPTLLQGCYRSAGEERFISIAVGTDAEWLALCEEMADPAMVDDERFATALLRLEHREAIDRCINAWTARHENVTLAERLQARGVAAFPTLNGEEAYSAPHLWEREAFSTFTHPLTGNTATLVGPPWSLSGTPVSARGMGPVLGEHNEYVFGELLGLSSDEIAQLSADGVLS